MSLKGRCKHTLQLIFLLELVPRALSQICNNENKKYMDNEMQISLRMCCGIGYAYSLNDYKCVRNEEIFNPPIVDNNFNVISTFNFNCNKRRLNCSKEEARLRLREVHDEHVLGITTDGNLLARDMENRILMWHPEQYCVDNFVSLNNLNQTETKVDAIICVVPSQSQENYVFTSVCLLISCIFMLMTVVVYACLKELNKLHRRIMISYLVCLLLGYIFLATLQILLHHSIKTEEICGGLTIVGYFFLLSSFFWLNVMCFDIWRTFSSNFQQPTTNLSMLANFYWYSGYAFGIPSAVTILYISLNYSKFSQESNSTCFLNGTERFHYLYLPILILWVANTIFFIMTIRNIYQFRQQISNVLTTANSAIHNSQKKEKRRFFLYIKLYIVMGVNWVMEVLSAYIKERNIIWKITDTWNSLIGVFIFAILICKLKTFRMLKQKYKKAFSNTNNIQNSSIETTFSSIKTSSI